MRLPRSGVPSSSRDRTALDALLLGLRRTRPGRAECRRCAQAFQGGLVAGPGAAPPAPVPVRGCAHQPAACERVRAAIVSGETSPRDAMHRVLQEPSTAQTAPTGPADFDRAEMLERNLA